MRTFGRYQIIEEIGAGAMGAVYKATDPVMDRDVAVKTILTYAIEGPQAGEFRERFFREARAAGRLSHPGIVTIYDVSEHEGTPFLVMEYIAGRNLQAILQDRGRMEMDRIYDLAIQLSEALGYAHKNGVVHRDIKPSNILLTADDRVKIADFGVARLAESQLTFTGGQLLGTPAFMSPEQFTGIRTDHRADLFAAGVVLYWMATGDKPFTGETLLAVQYKVVNTDPVPPRVLNPLVSRALEAVIMKALAKDPAERYQSGEELAEDLRAARGSRAVSAKPVTRPSDDTPTLMARSSPSPIPPPRPAPQPPQPRTPIGLLVLFVIATLVLLWAVGIVRIPGGQSPPQVAVVPPPANSAPAAGKKNETKKRPAPVAEVKPESITLELTAQDRSNIVFRTEGQPMQTLSMKPGDSMTLHAEKEARVSITNAPALQVKLNGKPLALGDHPNGQWVITPEGIDESRSALAKGGGPPGAPPFPGTPPVLDNMFRRGNRGGKGSAFGQSELANSPTAVKLQIKSPSIPPFLTLIVRVDDEVIYRREATAEPPRGRPDPAALSSSPIAEERLLPAGNHKIDVSLMQGAVRVGQRQELTRPFIPGEPRTLLIEMIPDRGNPRIQITIP